jgi:hypothetical protein
MESLYEFLYVTLRGLFGCAILVILMWLCWTHVIYTFKSFLKIFLWDFKDEQDKVKAFGYFVGVNGLLFVIYIYCEGIFNAM